MSQMRGRQFGPECTPEMFMFQIKCLQRYCWPLDLESLVPALLGESDSSALIFTWVKFPEGAVFQSNLISGTNHLLPFTSWRYHVENG